jgi:hypothetical protein
LRLPMMIAKTRSLPARLALNQSYRQSLTPCPVQYLSLAGSGSVMQGENA